MAELDSLIRVRKHTVDQKQKFLADLYRQAEDFDLQRAVLEAQLQDEQTRVKDMGVGMLNFFGAYSVAVKSRIEEIIASRKKLEARIHFAQEEIRIAFAELKKIEIIHERRKQEEKEARDKKDSATLDEIAIDGFRRQDEEKS